MPLSKRTEKRLHQKAREDEEGLTELKAGLKEEMGEGSSGSFSGSSSGSSSEDEDEEDGAEDESDDESEERLDSEDDTSDEEEDSSDDEADAVKPVPKHKPSQAAGGTGSNSDPFPLTISQTLTNPIYAIEFESQPAHMWALCPGVLLKDVKRARMVEVHLNSGKHSRAVRRFERYLNEHKETVNNDGDPREIIETLREAVQEKARKDATEGKKARREQFLQKKREKKYGGKMKKQKRIKEKKVDGKKRKHTDVDLSVTGADGPAKPAGKRSGPRALHKEKKARLLAEGQGEGGEVKVNRPMKRLAPRSVRKEKKARLMMEAGSFDGGTGTGNGNASGMGESKMNRLANLNPPSVIPLAAVMKSRKQGACRESSDYRKDWRSRDQR